MDIILRESQRLDQAIRDFLTFARPGEFAPEPRRPGQADRGQRQAAAQEPASSAPATGSRRGSPSPRDRVRGRSQPPEAGVLEPGDQRAEGDARRRHADASSVELRDADGAGRDRLRATRAWAWTSRERERYFQPFSSSFGEGTGLGAAIVYRLVEEHGGRIHLDSAPGQGTRVRDHRCRRTSAGRGAETEPAAATQRGRRLSR